MNNSIISKMAALVGRITQNLNLNLLVALLAISIMPACTVTLPGGRSYGMVPGSGGHRVFNGNTFGEGSYRGTRHLNRVLYRHKTPGGQTVEEWIAPNDPRLLDLYKKKGLKMPEVDSATQWYPVEGGSPAPTFGNEGGSAGIVQRPAFGEGSGYRAPEGYSPGVNARVSPTGQVFFEHSPESYREACREKGYPFYEYAPQPRRYNPPYGAP